MFAINTGLLTVLFSVLEEGYGGVGSSPSLFHVQLDGTTDVSECKEQMHNYYVPVDTVQGEFPFSDPTLEMTRLSISVKD